MEVERITEKQLYPKIRRLVEDYGELNTVQLKQLLIPILEGEGLADEDWQILAGRNDRKIDQKIRNVGAHAPQGKVTYMPGFAIDKTGNEIFFRPLIAGLIPTPSQTQEKKERNRKYIARRVDYGKKSERDRLIGLAGEELVVHYEQDRLKDLLPNFNPNTDVIHLSQTEGDGAGYDILSKNEDGSIRRIEVKTTTGGLDAAFYMSENERAFMDEYQDESTYIYRVYNFNKDAMMGDLKIIPAKELLNNYDFNCIAYKITPKDAS